MYSQKRKQAAEKFDKNVTKRGSAATKLQSNKDEKSSVGTAIVVLFLFVVVGSTVLQMLRTYMTGAQGE
eukprot:CAMPEP_0198722564 /NCGR_PEP_ID=MMETSP1475-20131203/254_1 /TAXON_ID= ORGANISM="Unidentified sp., Strain CCMP1999" /NCGR_SAMPLE_ID=MMETSP1475 /ASSEMBLY_ACC=CAM_ASM_001111 /LENGTH=68 /DNA_ID=CAMNT_0044483477 /DNA_START=79 /DNA_END=285 /DNA_ORIENTATION=-